MAIASVPVLVHVIRAHSGAQLSVQSPMRTAAQHWRFGAPDFSCAKPLKAVSLRCFVVCQKHQGEAV